MSPIKGLLIASTLGVAAPPSHAADLVVLSAAAMKTAVLALSDGFTAATGDHVRFTFGTAGFIRDKAAAGEAFDVVIVPPAPLADLVRRGLVIDGSLRNLALVRLGAAVRSGAPHPAIDTPDAFKAAIRAATSVGLADPATGATSGIYLVKMLEQLGLLDEVRPKLKLYPEGQTAMEAAARGEIGFGLGQISEIMPVSGVELLGPIPESLRLKTIYAAGLAKHSATPEHAARLLDYLQGKQALASFKAQGFEAAPAP